MFPALDDIIDVSGLPGDVPQKPLKDICWDFIVKVEKNIINKALKQTNWNRKKAALDAEHQLQVDAQQNKGI